MFHIQLFMVQRTNNDYVLFSFFLKVHACVELVWLDVIIYNPRTSFLVSLRSFCFSTLLSKKFPPLHHASIILDLLYLTALVS